MIKPAPILIAGPTASGKSEIALALAERLDGTVINADAMQVYRELRILTARPSAEDERRAPHLLYGHVPAAEAYSAARYAEEAREAIASVQASGRVPIVVGGTGLYFKALTEGLSPIPAVPAEIRTRWRERAGDEGPKALHEILKTRDPEMAARLRPTDPQRIVRALEVLETTGISLATWQEKPGDPVVRLKDTTTIALSRDPDELKRRCDLRFDRMMAEGAVEEVRALIALGLASELPAMRALGVQPLAQMIAGQRTREEAMEAAKADTRRYVKRQRTWMSRNMMSWKQIYAQEMESLIGKIIDFVKSRA